MDLETAWFLNAFATLSSGRPIGMAPGPIPLADVVTYWRAVGRVGTLREFIGVIRALDAEFLAMATKAK